MAGLIVKTIVVTEFMQNCRLLVDSSSSQATVVDPGGDVERILAVVEESGAKVSSILLTHAHLDHAGGVEKLCQILQRKNGKRPELLAHPLEKDMRGRVSDQALMFGLSPSAYQNVSEPETYINQGDYISVGQYRGLVLFTPGHSPGHVSVYFEKGYIDSMDIDIPIVIAGDVLFAGSIGRTDLPGGDHSTLIESVKQKIFTLPERTIVMPGHGPETTVGVEKRTNPFF